MASRFGRTRRPAPALIVVVALVAALLRFVAGDVASATPTVSSVGTYCAGNQAGGAAGTLPVPLEDPAPPNPDFGITVDVTTDGPATLSPGQAFSVELDVSAAVDLHTKALNVWRHISRIGSAELHLSAPANATFQGFTIGAPGNLEVASVAVVGSEILIKSSSTVTNTSTWTQNIQFDHLTLNFTAASTGSVQIKPGGTVAVAGGTPATAPLLHAAVVLDLAWTAASKTDTPPNPNPGQIVVPIDAVTDCQAGPTEVDKVLYAAPIQAPAIAITNPVNGASFQQAPPAAAQFGAVTCTFPPAGAKCQGRIDNGAWFDMPDTANPLNAVAGAHTFSARMIDNAGNPVGGVATLTNSFTVQQAQVADQVPPTVTITSPVNGAVFTAAQSPNPTYQFSCSDPAPGAIASCKGEYAQTMAGPWTTKVNGSFIPLVALGNQPTHYVFRVTATDQAGNKTVKVHAYTVMPGSTNQSGGFNCTGGVAVVPVGGGGAWNGNNCVPFVSNSAPTTVVIGNTFTWSASMGAQTYTAANNVKVTYTFKPTGGTFSNPQVLTSGQGTSNATATISGAGDLVISFTKTASPFTPPSFNVVVTPTVGVGGTVGAKLTKITAGNAGVNPTWLGLPNAPNLTTTTVIGPPDTTPPVINFTSPAHGAVFPAGTPIPVAYSCVDNVPTPTCVTTPAGVANGSTLNPAPGVYQLAVTSVDAAGNIAYEEHTYYVVQQSSKVSISGCTAIEAVNCDVTVAVTPPSSGPVTVTLTATPGSASASDFGPAPTTVTVPANQASAVAAVPTTDDAEVEPTETFSLAISNPVGTNVDLDPTASTATGTITDWNTTNQCAARWPLSEQWQVDWAIQNLPGGDGTVQAVIAAGFAYWQNDLAGLTTPLDPGYVVALPPSGGTNVTYTVTFTQAFYNNVIVKLMATNNMSCDDVVTGALYLGVLIAFGSAYTGSSGSDAFVGGTECRIGERVCTIDDETRNGITNGETYGRALGELDTGPPRTSTSSETRATSTTEGGRA